MELAFFLALFVPAACVQLVNNSYKDVLIAIKSDIAEDPSLIETLKDAFTQASAYLYQATHKRAYFGEITIVVPESWTNVAAEAATAAETFSRAQVRINPPEVFFGFVSNTAYVQSTALCGGEGLYMHITPGRLTDPTWVRASPPYRMIVHEWAHLRWGVFDEYHQYGLDDDGRAGRCTQQIAAIPSSGRWRFTLNTVTGSIMWKQYYNQVVDFCDDGDDPKTRHYRSSNTAQNRFCNMQSVWGVMLQTVDFRDGANPPRDVTSTKPTFRVVKKQDSPIVFLVLDISNSMVINARMTKVRQSAKSYINSVADGTQIGIIVFDATATVVHSPTTVTDQASRDDVGSKLPTYSSIKFATGGRTNLTNGVLMGVDEILKTTNMNRELVVISDGMTNQMPDLTDDNVAKRIMDSRVRVHTIGIGATETSMSKISDMTGGMAFADLEATSQPGAMQEALSELTTGTEVSYKTAHMVATGMLSVANGTTVKKSIIIDPGVGRDTVINIDYGEYSYTKLRIKVIAPKCLSTPPPAGVQCGMTYKSRDNLPCDNDFKMCVLRLPMAQPGVWTLSVYNERQTTHRRTVYYTVTSKQADKKVSAVRMEAFLSTKRVVLPGQITVTALLLNGSLAILDATVVAVISHPDGDPIQLYLRDEGTGPDQFRGDGLYSGTFTEFTMSGSYNVKVIATALPNDNMDMTAVNNGSILMEKLMRRRRATAQYPPRKDDYDFEGVMPEPPNPVSVFDFMRVKSAGMFDVDMATMSDSIDMFPPSRIMDLKGYPKFNGSQTITLSWTAPGDDMETGTASSYTVRTSKTFEALADRFDEQKSVTEDMFRSPRSKIMPAPQMANLEEKLSFLNPYEDADTVYVAVKTEDGNNRMSGLSNVVAVNMKPCKCPKLSEAVCKETYVILARVKSVVPMVTLSDARIVKPDFEIPGFTPQIVSSLNRGVKCNCPQTLEKDKRYLFTASLNKDVRLEVANDSYVEIVAEDDVNSKYASTLELVKKCP